MNQTIEIIVGPDGTQVRLPHPTHGLHAAVVPRRELDAEGRLSRVVAAHDVGRAINPLLAEGQIEGGVHMALGQALSEEFPVERGVPQVETLKALHIIPPTGMPEVEVILVEEHQPEGPFGAKGVGEAAVVPTAAATAAALFAYDGIRRTRLPMRDAPAAIAARPASTDTERLRVARRIVKAFCRFLGVEVMLHVVGMHVCVVRRLRERDRCGQPNHGKSTKG